MPLRNASLLVYVSASILTFAHPAAAGEAARGGQRLGGGAGRPGEHSPPDHSKSTLK